MRKSASLFSLVFLLLSALPIQLQAQDLPSVVIQIISENAGPHQSVNSFEEAVKQEIQTLLKNRYQPVFKQTYANFDMNRVQTLLIEAESDLEVDIVITVGAMSSAIMASQTSFSKPSIATFILDSYLQRVPLTNTGTSGIPNFTYVQSPFDVQRDLETLHRIYPFKHIGFVGFPGLMELLPVLNDIFGEIVYEFEADFSFIPLTEDVDDVIDQLPEDIDACYMLPDLNLVKEENIRKLVDHLNENKVATSGLFGDVMIQNGILMGYESQDNIQKLPRRVAINTLKILEGADAGELPVRIPTYNETLLINLEAARKSGHYPDFDLMGESILVNFDKVDTDRRVNLSSVVAEALQNNLNLSIAQLDPQIASKDVDLARANLLPTITASSSLARVDSFTAASSFGGVGLYTLFLNGELSQTVFSEPALANVAIQKFLQKGTQYELEQAQLDVILDAAAAYLTVLQARTVLRIQEENVGLTKENYDISKAKEAVGYVGASDLARWESELAQRSIDLNDAGAQYRQAVFSLNQMLNRPIDEDFVLEDIKIGDHAMMVMDDRIGELVNNYGTLRKFSNFLVAEGMKNLPEIKQIDYSILAQDRLRKSQNRAFFLPSLGLSGKLDYTANRWQVIDPNLPPEIPLNQNNPRPSWNIGLGLSYNILEGGRRKADLQRTKLSLVQLRDQRSLVKQQLELRIRSTMELAGASFARVSLAQEAAEAGERNFKIVQDAYSQGLVNVTALIDAQQASLQAALSSENANYQFIIDFLTVERTIGFYYFLKPKVEQDAFYERLLAFLNESE